MTMRCATVLLEESGGNQCQESQRSLYPKPAIFYDRCKDFSFFSVVVIIYSKKIISMHQY